MLLDLQRAFRAAVLGAEDGGLHPHVAAPRGNAASRIDVYRNTVQASLVEVLAAAFPVTQQIVGTDFFAGLARAFIAAQPPRAPQLSTYGAHFPQFIIGPSSEYDLPYLPDVAQLEWMRGESYFAADAPMLAGADMAKCGNDVGQIRLRLHPAARLIHSPFPVFTIWETHQHEHSDNVSSIDMGLGEVAIISRPAMHVITRRITEGDGVFVEALAGGLTLGSAAEAAAIREPDFDLQGALEAHLRQGTFTAAI